MAVGFNQVIITNSDTPDHTDLFRYVDSEGIASKIRIAKDLGEDAVFDDWEIISGIAYRYVARSYLSTGGYSDSAPSDAETQALDGLWITQVTRESVTSNSALSLNLFITGTQQTPAYQMASREFKGRTKMLSVFGQNISQVLNYAIVVPNVDLARLDTLEALYRANTTLCVRDALGNRIFGRLMPFQFQDELSGDYFNISFREEHFVEEV
jgi:hypothetical protein